MEIRGDRDGPRHQQRTHLSPLQSQGQSEPQNQERDLHLCFPEILKGSGSQRNWIPNPLQPPSQEMELGQSRARRKVGLGGEGEGGAAKLSPGIRTCLPPKCLLPGWGCRVLAQQLPLSLGQLDHVGRERRLEICHLPAVSCPPNSAHSL